MKVEHSNPAMKNVGKIPACPASPFAGCLPSTIGSSRNCDPRYGQCSRSSQAANSRMRQAFFLQAPQVFFFSLQCLQDLQLLQALQGSAPVHVAQMTGSCGPAGGGVL